MKNSLPKTTLIASLGTLLEWAEYIFYGYMSLIFAKLFFPAANETANLIKTYGIFAAGYLMRPLGAVVFGIIGDKYGRRKALMISMIMMGIATACIGLLPTYEMLGIWAPILLLCCRLLQGLSVGGEHNGAAIFVIEHSIKRPCFTGSFIAAGAAFGMVFGGLASFLVSLEGMPIWAYRVPFLFGGMVCFFGIWLRSSLEEPHEYLQAKSNAMCVSWWQLLTNYKTSFVRVGVIAAFTGVFVYIGNVYFVIYLTKQVGFAFQTATFIAVCAQLGVTLFIPVMGWVADHTNPHTLYSRGLLLAAVGTPTFYWLSAAATPIAILISISIYVLLNTWTSGPLMKIIQDEFPTLLRYRGISLAWNIAAAAFGGTALMVAEMLQTYLQTPLAPSLYVALFAMVTWATLKITSKKTIELQSALVPNI